MSPFAPSAPGCAPEMRPRHDAPRVSGPLAVLLVAGGWSPERGISLRGADAIAHALRERGHTVTVFDLADGFAPLLDLATEHDVAFLNLHGRPGEDGLVQALLDRAGCPYQGSGPAGSFLALHKAAAKVLFRRAGLLTPDWIFLSRRPDAAWKPDLPYPLFVKSATGGSSLDLYRAHDEASLRDALNALFDRGQEVLVEPLIPGREVTCGVLDPGKRAAAPGLRVSDPKKGKTEAETQEARPVEEPDELRPLPPVLIVPKREFFDYHDKYADDGAAELCPAPLPEETVRHIQRAAMAAHRCLGLGGYSRADFILTDDGGLYLLEVNTLPGMTAASLVPKEAAAAGIPFGELLETLLGFALERTGRPLLQSSPALNT